MENREGILISGAGRVESPAELSENEERFSDIVDFIIDGLSDFIKKYHVNEVKLRNNLSRNFIKNLREYIKMKKDITVYEALERYFQDKENGLELNRQAWSEMEKIMKKKMAESTEYLVTQSIFSKLNKNPNIADIVGDEGKKGDEYIN